MGASILVAVVVAALFVVASGAWVAVALVRAISTKHSDTNLPGEETNQAAD